MCCVWFCILSYKRDMDVLEWVQRRATKTSGGLEHLTWKRLRDMELVSLERRRWSVTWKCVWIPDVEPTCTLEPIYKLICSEKMSDSGHKWKYRKTHLNVWRRILYCKAGQTVKQIAWRHYGVPILKTQLDSLEHPAVIDHAQSQKVGLDHFQRCPPASIILWICKNSFISVLRLYRDSSCMS